MKFNLFQLLPIYSQVFLLLANISNGLTTHIEWKDKRARLLGLLVLMIKDLEDFDSESMSIVANESIGSTIYGKVESKSLSLSLSGTLDTKTIVSDSELGSNESEGEYEPKLAKSESGASSTNREISDSLSKPSADSTSDPESNRAHESDQSNTVHESENSNHARELEDSNMAREPTHHSSNHESENSNSIHDSNQPNITHESASTSESDATTIRQISAYFEQTESINDAIDRLKGTGAILEGVLQNIAVLNTESLQTVYTALYNFSMYNSRIIERADPFDVELLKSVEQQKLTSVQFAWELEWPFRMQLRHYLVAQIPRLLSECLYYRGTEMLVHAQVILSTLNIFDHAFWKMNEIAQIQTHYDPKLQYQFEKTFWGSFLLAMETFFPETQYNSLQLAERIEYLYTTDGSYATFDIQDALETVKTIIPHPHLMNLNALSFGLKTIEIFHQEIYAALKNSPASYIDFEKLLVGIITGGLQFSAKYQQWNMAYFSLLCTNVALKLILPDSSFYMQLLYQKGIDTDSLLRETDILINQLLQYRLVVEFLIELCGESSSIFLWKYPLVEPDNIPSLPTIDLGPDAFSNTTNLRSIIPIFERKCGPILANDPNSPQILRLLYYAKVNVHVATILVFALNNLSSNVDRSWIIGFEAFIKVAYDSHIYLKLDEDEIVSRLRNQKQMHYGAHDFYIEMAFTFSVINFELAIKLLEESIRIYPKSNFEHSAKLRFLASWMGGRVVGSSNAYETLHINSDYILRLSLFELRNMVRNGKNQILGEEQQKKLDNMIQILFSTHFTRMLFYHHLQYINNQGRNIFNQLLFRKLLPAGKSYFLGWGSKAHALTIRIQTDSSEEGQQDPRYTIEIINSGEGLEHHVSRNGRYVINKTFENVPAYYINRILRIPTTTDDIYPYDNFAKAADLINAPLFVKPQVGHVCTTARHKATMSRIWGKKSLLLLYAKTHVGIFLLSKLFTRPFKKGPTFKSIRLTLEAKGTIFAEIVAKFPRYVGKRISLLRKHNDLMGLTLFDQLKELYTNIEISKYDGLPQLQQILKLTKSLVSEARTEKELDSSHIFGIVLLLNKRNHIVSIFNGPEFNTEFPEKILASIGNSISVKIAQLIEQRDRLSRTFEKDFDQFISAKHMTFILPLLHSSSIQKEEMNNVSSQEILKVRREIELSTIKEKLDPFDDDLLKYSEQFVMTSEGYKWTYEENRPQLLQLRHYLVSILPKVIKKSLLDRETDKLYIAHLTLVILNIFDRSFSNKAKVLWTLGKSELGFLSEYEKHFWIAAFQTLSGLSLTNRLDMVRVKKEIEKYANDGSIPEFDFKAILIELSDNFEMEVMDINHLAFSRTFLEQNRTKIEDIINGKMKWNEFETFVATISIAVLQYSVKYQEYSPPVMGALSLCTALTLINDNEDTSKFVDNLSIHMNVKLVEYIPWLLSDVFSPRYVIEFIFEYCDNCRHHMLPTKYSHKGYKELISEEGRFYSFPPEDYTTIVSLQSLIRLVEKHYDLLAAISNSDLVKIVYQLRFLTTNVKAGNIILEAIKNMPVDNCELVAKWLVNVSKFIELTHDFTMYSTLNSAIENALSKQEWAYFGYQDFYAELAYSLDLLTWDDMLESRKSTKSMILDLFSPLLGKTFPSNFFSKDFLISWLDESTSKHLSSNLSLLDESEFITQSLILELLSQRSGTTNPFQLSSSDNSMLKYMVGQLFFAHITRLIQYNFVQSHGDGRQLLLQNLFSQIPINTIYMAGLLASNHYFAALVKRNSPLPGEEAVTFDVGIINVGDGIRYHDKNELGQFSTIKTFEHVPQIHFNNILASPKDMGRIYRSLEKYSQPKNIVYYAEGPIENVHINHQYREVMRQQWGGNSYLYKLLQLRIITKVVSKFKWRANGSQESIHVDKEAFIQLIPNILKYTVEKLHMLQRNNQSMAISIFKQVLETIRSIKEESKQEFTGLPKDITNVSIDQLWDKLIESDPAYGRLAQLRDERETLNSASVASNGIVEKSNFSLPKPGKNIKVLLNDFEHYKKIVENIPDRVPSGPELEYIAKLTNSLQILQLSLVPSEQQYTHEHDLINAQITVMEQEKAHVEKLQTNLERFIENFQKLDCKFDTHPELEVIMQNCLIEGFKFFNTCAKGFEDIRQYFAIPADDQGKFVTTFRDLKDQEFAFFMNFNRLRHHYKDCLVSYKNILDVQDPISLNNLASVDFDTDYEELLKLGMRKFIYLMLCHDTKSEVFNFFATCNRLEHVGYLEKLEDRIQVVSEWIINDLQTPSFKPDRLVNTDLFSEKARENAKTLLLLQDVHERILKLCKEQFLEGVSIDKFKQIEQKYSILLQRLEQQLIGAVEGLIGPSSTAFKLDLNQAELGRLNNLGNFFLNLDNHTSIFGILRVDIRKSIRKKLETGFEQSAVDQFGIDLTKIPNTYDDAVILEESLMNFFDAISHFCDHFDALSDFAEEIVQYFVQLFDEKLRIMLGQLARDAKEHPEKFDMSSNILPSGQVEKNVKLFTKLCAIYDTQILSFIDEESDMYREALSTLKNALESLPETTQSAIRQV